MSSTLLCFSVPRFSRTQADLFFSPPLLRSLQQEKTKKILDIWTKGLTFPPEVLKRVSARVAAAIADAPAPTSTLATAPVASSSSSSAVNGSRDTSERPESSDQSKKKSSSPPNSGAYHSSFPFLLFFLHTAPRPSLHLASIRPTGDQLYPSTQAALESSWTSEIASSSIPPLPFRLLEQVVDYSLLAGRISMPFPFSSFLASTLASPKETRQQ